VGQYRIHDSAENLVRLRTCNFIHCDWDGTALYMSLAYLPGRHSSLNRDGAAQLTDTSLTAEDIWTGQLCLDGYSDDELAVLFGISADAMSDLVARFIDRIGPGPERKYASLLSSPASLPESKCAEPYRPVRCIAWGFTELLQITTAPVRRVITVCS